MESSESGKNSLITQCIKQMFQGVRPGWRKVLMSPTLKPKLNFCLHELDRYLTNHGVTQVSIAKNGLGAYIRPKPQNILEAFKHFDPNNMIAIIVGQDPYPKPEDACGLCFSVNAKCKIPVSLNVIYKCLKKQNCLDEEPQNGDLIGWAKQGVLLINKYLTRSPNIKKNEKGEVWVDGNGNSDPQFLHTFWGDFTTELIKYLTGKYFNSVETGAVPRLIANHNKHYLAILLWGKHAQELIPYINQKNDLAT